MMRLISRLPSAPDVNPDVVPTKPFSHTAFYSLALAVAEWAGHELSLWSEPPGWVRLVLMGLPWVVALLRKRSYRVAPDAVIRPPSDGVVR